MKPASGNALLVALNAAAARLQSSIRSEQAVYTAFREQVIKLGLRGGVSLLDDSGKTLVFRVIAYNNPLTRIISGFEAKLRFRAEGYRIAIHKVDVYNKVITRAEALFIPDTSVVSVQVVPKSAKWIVGPLLKALGSPPGIFAPLVLSGKVIGMLNIVGPELTQADVPALQAFANHIAIAVENARLVAHLQSTQVELQEAYDATLKGWVQALDLRDNQTEGHTLRVAEKTVQFARHLGVPEAELPSIHQGALLHDMGKMALPDSILRKPGPLDEAEWRLMKKHPELAYQWLFAIPYLKKALDIPLSHHEKWDGSGYPRGLRGETIPLAARIFMLVDVWDAMTSDRPYRQLLPENTALQYIRDQAGLHFDPWMAEQFIIFLNIIHK